MPVPENENGPWSKAPESPLTQDKPKIEPWILFGAALIVSVASVLFAIGVWMVRSHQTDSALERETATSEKLSSTQQELDIITTQAETLRLQVAGLDEQFTELKVSEATEQQELQKVSAELESIKRERDQYKSTLEESRRYDSNPSSLETASLAQAVGSLDAVVASVYLYDVDRLAGLTRGALLENLKQLGRTKCAIGFKDSGNVRFALNVIVASSNDRAAISVSLSLVKAWKVPGQDMKHQVNVWQKHIGGLSSTERASAFVEELVESLIDSLASELGK